MATWKLDPSHSEVGFWVRHLMVTKVRGQFKQVEGSASIDGDDFTTAKVNATVQIASIDTREEKRDAHLRSPDFFDAEKFATMTFTSSRIEKAGETYKMHGALTIKGTTKDVTFEVESVGKAKDPWGGTRWGFEAKTTVKRGEFGLGWNQILEAGGVMVSEEVHIELNAQLIAA